MKQSDRADDEEGPSRIGAVNEAIIDGTERPGIADHAGRTDLRL